MKNIFATLTYSFFFILFGGNIFAQGDPITTYTVTKTNGTCLSTSSITLTFPTPASGSYSSGWSAQLETTSSVVLAQLSVPTSGGSITFSNLSNGNYNIKVTNGATTIASASNPINLTSSYTNMTVTPSSTKTTCTVSSPTYVDDGTVTLTVTGGVGPFKYTVTSPTASIGTKTFTTSSRSHTFTGMRGNETVNYTVEDQGCGPTASSSYLTINNDNADVNFGIRGFNLVRDCSNGTTNCSTPTLYVNLNHGVGIAGRLTILQAAGNSTIKINNGALVDLTYVGLIGGEYRFKYVPPPGATPLKHGDAVSVSFNYGCKTLTHTTTVNYLENILDIGTTYVTDNITCTLKYRLDIYGSINSSPSLWEQRNLTYCENNNLIVEKKNNSGVFETVFSGSFDTYTGRSDHSQSKSIFVDGPGIYRVTGMDICHTVTKEYTVQAPTTSTSRFSGVGVSLVYVSVMQGTKGIQLTGIDKLNFPIKVRLERVDGQTSMNINPSGPFDNAGTYTLNFPATYTLYSNPGSGNNFKIVDIPGGEYNVTITDNCSTVDGLSKTFSGASKINVFGNGSEYQYVLNGQTFTSSVTGIQGCSNSTNSISFQHSRDYNTYRWERVELSQILSNGSSGAALQSMTNTGGSANTVTGTFSNVQSGNYYVTFFALDRFAYSAALNTVGPFTYKTKVYIPPYQNLDINVNSVVCNPTSNTAIVTAKVSSGTLQYPLTMQLFQSDGTAVSGVENIDSPYTEKSFRDVPIGSYYIRITTPCYSFNKNITISTTSTPPTVDPPSAFICGGATTTTAVLNTTSTLYDVNWYVQGSSSSLGTGTSIVLNPSTTTTYEAKYKLANIYNCTSSEIFTSSFTITVTDPPNLTAPVVSDIDICTNTSRDITISNTQSGYTYEIVDGSGQSYNPKVTAAGTGSTITVTLPSHVLLAPGTMKVNISNGNATLCKGTLNDVISITQSSPEISNTVIGSAVCASTNGTIKVNNSVSGNTYTILKNGSPLSPNLSLTGNGSTLTFTVPAAELTSASNVFTIEVSSPVCGKAILTNTASITIQQNPTVNVTNEFCNGNDGTLTVTTTGGSGAYDYSLDNTNWNTTSNTFTGLNSGDYTVYARDKNNLTCKTQVSAKILDNCPKLSLIKTASQATYTNVGNVITYTFTVKNESSFTLSNIEISDQNIPNAVFTPATVASLQPGATATFTATYTITQADMANGSFTNTATAKGYYNNVQYISNSSSVTITKDIVLPSTGLILSGKITHTNDAELNWSTATESNTSYFTIERSTDGIQFTTINKSVKAAGSSRTTQYYSSIDYLFPIGITVYYRVRLFDLDGKNKLSNTILLEKKGPKQIGIYPNPVSDKITIVFGENSTYEILLFGYNGQLIKKVSNLNITNSNRSYTLERGSLLEGTYVLRIINVKSGDIHHEKLIFLQK